MEFSKFVSIYYYQFISFSNHKIIIFLLWISQILQNSIEIEIWVWIFRIFTMSICKILQLEHFYKNL